MRLRFGGLIFGRAYFFFLGGGGLLSEFYGIYYMLSFDFCETARFFLAGDSTFLNFSSVLKIYIDVCNNLELSVK